MMIGAKIVGGVLLVAAAPFIGFAIPALLFGVSGTGWEGLL